MEKITTDICIIGAGPVGLFAVFEAGLLKMRCHLIDVLPQVGGQLSEIYPHKPIYDIPGYPDVTAQQLVDNLMLQIAPFHPTFSLGERVENLQRNEDGSYNISTNDGTIVHCQVVVIAGGLGCFEPRKPEIDRLTDFEGKGVAYMVKNPEHFRNKKVVLAGGGDSALDWAVFLSNVAERVTLIHRGDTFRGAPDSAEKVFELAREGKIDLILKSNVVALTGDDRLQEITLLDRDQQVSHIEADHLIPLFGLSPKLGPIADWGLNIDRSAIAVNTVDYSTNIERIYAIGDINIYPGKLKLILCGFHESALMAQSAFKYVYPEQKLSFKYTTVYGVSAF
ncbi:NAD(P)/FAD-dependent oxidoreductase [Mucilaginibacter sp. cycad4]|uniref:NAD(P)/FAD-dependent oxidoreductase n=1 Tax=Mucilaginibacter sp. cycad4 TaxID=3342096 RepID=UPI002AAC3D0C|nr:NAD(P)/FAD-dependent oxidoreductase [Mucilaginibacter gossypii]WPU99542.1 NAD(P)/FAD-dependent oxidoreductase [Mucilaginibacter gossypii]